MSILLLLASCGPAELKTGKDSAPPPPPTPPELGIHLTDDCGQTAIGDKACNFALLDQESEYWQLKDGLGKVVVLDFSTVWCPPCQASAVHVQPLQDDYTDTAVIVTVLIDGPVAPNAPTMEDVVGWATSFGIDTAPVLQGSRELMFDITGQTGYSISSFPTYIYIDREGYIHGGHSGFSDEYVRQVIDSLL